MVLEVWSLGLSVDRCDSTVRASHTIYNRMSILLKSLISVSRVTPAYKLSRRQSADSYQILYRVYVGEPEIHCLGKCGGKKGEEGIRRSGLSWGQLMGLLSWLEVAAQTTRMQLAACFIVLRIFCNSCKTGHKVVAGDIYRGLRTVVVGFVVYDGGEPQHYHIMVLLCCCCCSSTIRKDGDTQQWQNGKVGDDNERKFRNWTVTEKLLKRRREEVDCAEEWFISIMLVDLQRQCSQETWINFLS